ncbi:hypothetical protein CVO71_08130 [Prochlorococcus marinus str. XMU1408]|nr:hypothetical protein [Prochlorococcus marinus str. XMU1408]
MPWDLSDIAMCGWCVDGLTFSPLFLYSISIRFLLLITNRKQVSEKMMIANKTPLLRKLVRKQI